MTEGIDSLSRNKMPQRKLEGIEESATGNCWAARVADNIYYQLTRVRVHGLARGDPKNIATIVNAGISWAAK